MVHAMHVCISQVNVSNPLSLSLSLMSSHCHYVSDDIITEFLWFQHYLNLQLSPSLPLPLPLPHTVCGGVGVCVQ